MTGARRDGVMAACTAEPGAAEDCPSGGPVAVFQAPAGGSRWCRPARCPAASAPRVIAISPPACVPATPGSGPGYHLSKRHGHTVTLDGPVPGQDVRELIDHSCHLVTARLTTAQRDQLIT